MMRPETALDFGGAAPQFNSPTAQRPSGPAEIPVTGTRPGKRVIVIGGGPGGLSAAYTLKKRGLAPLLLEATEQVGGRMGGERIDGFSTDKAADFFPVSYDTTFRLCEELGVPLTNLSMDIGWHRHGRWVVTTPITSLGTLFRNIGPFRTIGFLSLRGIWPTMKLVWSLKADARHLNYASTHRIADLDTDETYGEYLDRLGVPEPVRVTLEGFLGLTMGNPEEFGATWIRAFLAEVLFKPDKLYTPEGGCSRLSEALAERLGTAIRVSTPVRRVVIENGRATGVVTDDGFMEADAVICSVPATRALEIMPDLPERIRRALGKVQYSFGIRVVLGLDRRPLPPGWSAALYPEDDTPSLLDRTVNLPECAPPGKSLLDLWVGESRARDLMELDDEEIARTLLADAHAKAPPGSALPQYEDVVFARVYRWHDAICKGLPGMFTAMTRMRQDMTEDLQNLRIAGDFMRSPIVNGAITSGVETANEVADFLEARS